MDTGNRDLMLLALGFLLLDGFLIGNAWGKTHYKDFVLTEALYSRLCSTKNILTINGQYPGPTIYANKGDTVIVNVHNKADYNITLHWHGVKQPRNPWSDGPEFITQCPIKPRGNFSYTIVLSNEEGTMWWHAHSEWSRATVYGAIVVYPKIGTTYPFPKPYREVLIILGSWWKKDVMEVMEEALKSGREPQISDAHTINGQPGDLYPCSKQGTFRLPVEQGKTYLLRMINAAMNDEHFFSIAQHQLTVVGTDGSYIKPLTANYIMITPGQTMDVLFKASQPPSHYYMAARSYASANGLAFDNTTATAIVQYSGNYTRRSTPSFPSLPNYNDTDAATKFTSGFRSLSNKDHPIDVPLTVNTRIITTISVNRLPCANNSSCEGPNGTRFSASMSNISFVPPSVDILKAYYSMIHGVYETNFPREPPFNFNFTGSNLPRSLQTPTVGTKVTMLEYNSSVEIVIQGTSLLAAENHPMHLHGYNFYLVGSGFGNFDREKDPLKYNLVDPPEVNTIGVPRNGWAAIRFRADNPGVWFMHCHLERHASWGMNTVFIVKNGATRQARMLPPPRYMPPC